MGFDVYHSPQARTLGLNALRAGLGQYNLTQQKRQDAIAAQKRDIAAAAARQAQSLAAEAEQGRLTREATAENYRNLREWQGEQAKIEQDARIEAEKRKQLGQIQMEIGKRELDRREATNKFVNDGWREFAGSIKNWSDFTPSQQGEFQAIENGLAATIGNEALKPEEKEMAIKQAIIKAQGLLRMVVPKTKTKMDMLEEQGRGLGDTYTDEYGNVYATQPDLSTKLVARGISRNEIMASAIKIRESSLNPKTGVYSITMEEAFRMAEEYGKHGKLLPKPKKIEDIGEATRVQKDFPIKTPDYSSDPLANIKPPAPAETPLAEKAVSMTGGDISQMPPQMARDYELLLKGMGVEPPPAPQKAPQKETPKAEEPQKAPPKRIAKSEPVSMSLETPILEPMRDKSMDKPKISGPRKRSRTQARAIYTRLPESEQRRFSIETIRRMTESQLEYLLKKHSIQMSTP